jgi:hypothetical protein
VWEIDVLAPSDEVAGDYNGDGAVGAADYAIWRDTLNSSSDLRADGNGSLAIDSGDYDIWTQHFGSTMGSGAAAAIPEPPTGFLLPLLFSIIAVVRLRILSFHHSH